MKVAHAFKVYLPHRGGIVSTIQTLCEGLKDRIEPSILVSLSQGLGRKEWINGVPITRTSSLKELWAMPITPTYPLHFWHIARQVDVIDYHAPFPLIDLAVSIYFPEHTGLVIHWHSEIVAQQRTGRMLAPLVKRCLQRADRIIVSTPYHLEISPYLNTVADKCVVIPFGIDLTRWGQLDAQDRDEIEQVRSEFGEFFLTVGRLVPYKGMDLLIRAMAEVPGRLVIVGDGPLRANLASLADAPGTRGRVNFVGDVSFRRLKALMHACRFFVLPSAAPSETFGIVQLEAMVCGKAVINTDIHPGIGWVARNGQEALTIPALDSTALTQAIRYLQENPAEAIRLGNQGKSRVQQVFSQDRFLQDTLKLYQEVVDARHRSD